MAEKLRMAVNAKVAPGLKLQMVRISQLDPHDVLIKAKATSPTVRSMPPQ